MTKQKEVSANEEMIGKTIDSIDQTCQNALTIHFIDGTQISIMSECGSGPTSIPFFQFFNHLGDDETDPPFKYTIYQDTNSLNIPSIKTQTVEILSIPRATLAEWKKQNDPTNVMNEEGSLYRFLEKEYSWRRVSYEVTKSGHDNFIVTRKT